jgi:hypothetical protein
VRKEPTMKRCKWCNNWFPTTRNGKFCVDSHRTAWHRQTELDKNMRVFNGLRGALEYCVAQHPELLPEVNKRLSEVEVVLSSILEGEGA